MKDNSLNLNILQNYTFKKDKPIFTNSTYNVYNGVQNETNLPVTIKTIRTFHLELPKYLKKIKDCKSQSVIKVYETDVEQGTLVFITQKVSFGNLSDALTKSERLDDNDSIYVTKNLLNGHIDLLRSDCNWFGNEEDIQITDSGLKLSWNNGIGYNLVNPFPKMIQKFGVREEKGNESNLLPFPKNKIIADLIKVSRQNASQISLHPQMKKKEKNLRKKGKNWLGLKEYKNKNQYFDEVSYLAVSAESGFVRVKQYDSGKIDAGLLGLNKSKKTFTRVLETYEDGGKTFIVSEYSNDGNLQAYVTKLKNASVTLNEDHIQFFFYSMFEPIKQIQDSTLKSISMLHIKNIYIENGIPKIGEPIPMNVRLEESLGDRADVPDFYHSSFKKNHKTKNQSYDTYSLGVLLYKLMYTEYPIFPNGKVHIPTTPNYNKRLKTTLQIFLNEGGALRNLESRIQVSQNVVKQVKQNKEKLIVAKKVQSSNKQESKQYLIDDDKESTERKSDSDENSVEEEEDEVGCCAVCCAKLDLNSNEQASNKSMAVSGLEQSPYRVYRLCTKIFLITCFYVFLFYFFYIQTDVLFIGSQNVLITQNVTIATVEYPIITTDKTKFETSFNQTNQTVEALVGMGCFISGYNGNPTYSDFVFDNSDGWIGFIVAALLSIIVIVVLKGWQLYKFDLIKAIYNYENGKYNFNISNWIIYNLLWVSLIHGHFYFFNFIFEGATEPCVGMSKPYDSTTKLFNDRTTFQLVYVSTICLQYAAVIGSAIMIGCTSGVKYNKLINPIIIFGPLLITQWIILRIGVLNDYFAPNALHDDDNIILNYFLTGAYIGIFGMVPQLLLLGELLIGFIIDWIYWGFIEKRRRLLINETSAASIIDP